MNKQQLAAKIWESANQMRSKIEANEYKDYILGFIFYKFLSNKEIQFLEKEDFTQEDIQALTEDDEETVKYIKKNIGYFIGYDDLFSTWIERGKDFDVSNVRDALSAFSRLISPVHKKLFDGIFDTLQTGLSKLGESAAKQTKAISDLLHLIKDIPMDGKQDYDVLGYIYEYLIEKFASNAGKKAGEFYTPQEVSTLMSDIVAYHLKDKKQIEIYDPTSGSGSLLINIGASVARHNDGKDNIKYFAQELKKNTYNLTRMNLVMRGILPSNIVTRNGDTLEDDWPYFNDNDPVNSYNPLYVDAVVSNPPYSQAWNPDHKENDPRYARFGIAPKTKADYAFLLHDLYHIKPDGIMTIILPHGVLFRGGEEGKIRRNLIEQNHIDAIIGLPAGIFFGTGIPTVILILKQNRVNSDILIIDASKGFVKEGKFNKIRASDNKRITDTVRDRITIPKFSKLVTKETIRENDYNLNIPRYVDSAEVAENWDIYATMFGGIPASEIEQLAAYWKAFPNLKEALFTKNNENNYGLKTKETTQTITAHKSVQDFINTFNNAFSSFETYLKTTLLTNAENLNIAKEKTILANDMFNRLESSSLIDKYTSYQLLDDQWQVISVDLEIIQTEGLGATKIVEPNMVLKKKNGKDTEIQIGWKGRIMPFDLVQETYLKKELEALTQKENRLLAIASEMEEILGTFSEEEKEEETINEAKDAFVNAKVISEAKKYSAEQKKKVVFATDSYQTKILNTAKLLAEEKALKKQLKTETAALHLKTKKTIEALTDAQVNELLALKWIHPLVASIHQQPKDLIKTLSNTVNTLAQKYATTYADIAQEINTAETNLATMIADLTGSETDMQGLNELKNLLNGK